MNAVNKSYSSNNSAPQDVLLNLDCQVLQDLHLEGSALPQLYKGQLIVYARVVEMLLQPPNLLLLLLLLLQPPNQLLLQPPNLLLLLLLLPNLLLLLLMPNQLLLLLPNQLPPPNLLLLLMQLLLLMSQLLWRSRNPKKMLFHNHLVKLSSLFLNGKN
jgi:hypothetical protein